MVRDDEATASRPPRPPAIQVASSNSNSSSTLSEADAVTIAKLQAENRALQLQLLERRISECEEYEDPSSPKEADEEQVDMSTLDAGQLQLFSLGQQLRRERKRRKHLQYTLARQVQQLRVWMDHDRIRHREHILRLQSRLERPALATPPPHPNTAATSGTSASVTAVPLVSSVPLVAAGGSSGDSMSESQAAAAAAVGSAAGDGISPVLTPSPEEQQQFYYKYSAPVSNTSEEETRELIEQTASRTEQRRKHLASVRKGATPTPSSPLNKPTKDSIRLRGAYGKGKGKQGAAAGLELPPPENPNQIGQEISEKEFTREWYLRHALELAYMRMIPAVKEDDGAMAAAAAEEKESSRLPISAFGGVNSSSMQYAIQELLHLHFHLSDNRPVMTSGATRPHRLPALEADNSDPALLQAFDLSRTAHDDFSSPKHKDSRRSSSSHHTRSSSNSAASKSDYREDELRITFHAPVIFNQVRDFLRMDVQRFHQCLQLAVWRQSLSPGKSGTSLMYFGDFVMKSLPDSDYTMLTDHYLPAYAKYCEQYTHSLLTKFYAIVSVKWLKSGISKCYVLMQNVFTTKHYIHRIYDVKGSTIGRTAIQAGKPPPRTAFGALLLKDNDLPEQLLICGPQQRAALLQQLRLDLSFLESLSIVDYSMMIGVRSRVLLKDEEGSLKATDSVKPDEASCLYRCDGGLLSLPIVNEDNDSTREEVYYLGVIDVLQEYNSTKKLENFAKGLYNDRTQISVIPPPEYADRLLSAIERISR